MTNNFSLPSFAVAAIVSLALSACAPNAWQSPVDGPLSNAVDKIDSQLANCAPGEGQSGAADAFMTFAQNKCWGKHIGSMMISNNMSSDDNSAYFMDLTSRFYCGAVDQASYVNSLESFFNPVPIRMASSASSIWLPRKIRISRSNGQAVFLRRRSKRGSVTHLAACRCDG